MITFYPTAQAALIGACTGIAAFLVCLLVGWRIFKGMMRRHFEGNALVQALMVSQHKKTMQDVREAVFETTFDIPGVVDLRGVDVSAFGPDRLDVATPPMPPPDDKAYTLAKFPGLNALRVHRLKELGHEELRITLPILSTPDRTITDEDGALWKVFEKHPLGPPGARLIVWNGWYAIVPKSVRLPQ